MPGHVELLANDPHDQLLLRNTHPPQWTNPTPASRYNLVIVGAGTAGLVAAAGAALIGAKVALIERALTGGDCLVTGCVPSKAVIRCARAAAEVRGAGDYGLRVPGEPTPDFAAVMERMRRLRAQISAHDAARHFRDDRGIDVFFGNARFAGRDSIDVDGRRLRFRKAIIATGARPVLPDIPGLKQSRHFTNETVFNLTELPRRLAVVGGGPLGCELAQAFARLGSQVSILQKGEQFLLKEDRAAADLLLQVFRRENIEVHLNATVREVVEEGSASRLIVSSFGATTSLLADAILVGVGRTPNVEGLGLEVAGVRFNEKGVAVDDFLRTSNRSIYAAGDVCLPFKFTHMADASARIALQNALLPFRRRVSKLIIPRCTYSDPEIAHVGMDEETAGRKGLAVQSIFVPLAEIDRCITDGETEGFLKLHLEKGTDRILGATLVASHAGEIITQITTAMVGRIGLKKLARVIYPYPTQSEVIKKAADDYFQSTIGSGTRRWLKRWFDFVR